MKKLTLFKGALMCLLCFVVSCNSDEISDETNGKNSPKSGAEGVIPFTVENVKKALPQVLSYYRTNRPEVAERFSNYNVVTTHVYYSFSPQDSIQYTTLMQLESDLDLLVTVDPFEYTRKERTEDPEDNEIPIFYAIVPVEQVPDVNQVLQSGIPSSVVAELHFTDEDKLEDEERNYDEVEFKQNLMYEARKLVGHLDEEELAEGYMNYKEGFELKGLFGEKWRPSGNVRYDEDYISGRKGSLATSGVNKAQVTVLKWGFLRVESGYTNVSGDFSTGTTYTKHVHYNVRFTDHARVRIMAGNFYDLANWTSGSHKRRALDVLLTKHTRHQFYAILNNAAHSYIEYIAPDYGLKNPISINISGHFNGTESRYLFGAVPFSSEVKIGGKHGDGTRKQSDAVFASVMHEMTHKSHYKMDNSAFISVNDVDDKKFLRESWAQCVETVVTNSHYGLFCNAFGLGPYIASFEPVWFDYPVQTRNGSNQFKMVSEMNKYSPLLFDLTDTFNQQSYADNLPSDLVSGYTLQQIQHALNDSGTVSSFYDKLYNSYNNSTKEHIYLLKGYANTVVSNM